MRRDEGSRETLESIRSSREMLDNLRDVIAHGRQSLEEGGGHGAPGRTQANLRDHVASRALTADTLERLEGEVEAASRDVERRRSEMGGLIARLSEGGGDPREGLVLDLYYLHGLPWKQVTSATGLSRTTCTRLRTSALEHLGELAGDPQEGKTTRREHYK